MINYKSTLNLPNTKFPMRANLSKLEPKIIQCWNKNNLYNIIRKIKKGKKLFLLHDGPPYANGSIHMGHAVNKILKDIIIKSKSLSGYDAPYIPGWDCHGLPIELQVEKLIGKFNKKYNKKKFCEECRIYANKQILDQKKDFIRLGILADWENSYFTMDYKVEANILRTLGIMIEKGYVYKDSKPVHWCTYCQSALAEGELDYNKNHISSSIYVLFKCANKELLMKKFNIEFFSGSIFLVIWTTNPWTLLANRAIAVNADLEYQIIQINNNQAFIVSKKITNIFLKKIGLNNYNILGSILIGKYLEFLQFYNPLLKFNVPIILSNHVNTNDGTGLVHIAPSHGLEDYIVSKLYKLEIKNVIENNGYILSGILNEINNLCISDANIIIKNILRSVNSLIYEEKIQHSYPYCWRHNIPIIFRTTPQWFISMDKKELRTTVISSIKNVKWITNWGKNNMNNLVINRPDWCISRQRVWGVPITLFEHKYTKQLHPNTINFIEKIAKKVEQFGIQYWWDLDISEFLEKQDITNYNKVSDVLDVWFDAGSTFFSVIEKKLELLNTQSDLCIEGYDQYRGWFMSSLILSSAIHNNAPYKNIITHGFVVDGDGKKMSKSIGNIISPQTLLDKYGADIIRLWVASTDYSCEINISKEILDRIIDMYRRIRNTIRFLLSNLNDFDPNNNDHLINKKDMVLLDKFIIHKTKEMQKNIIAAYDKYDFHTVIKYITSFCSIDMGSFYLEVIKDRQYTIYPSNLSRRSAQTAIYHIAEAIIRWIAPIMSFTADEAWNYLPLKKNEYVFSEEWYSSLFSIDEEEKINEQFWNTIIEVRNEVNKAIETMRYKKIINSSLEAHIILYADSYTFNILKILGNELHFIFITSSTKLIEIQSNNKYQKLQIIVEKAKGEKCIRCWHYENNIGNNITYPNICSRCVNNILGPGETRKFI